MGNEGLKLTVALLAGLASFASPCVLPLVPAYLGMLTGLNLEGWANRRYQVLAHAGLFVFGFTLLFVASGAMATAFGRLLSRNMVLLQRLGGIALVLLGLHMLRILPLPFLYREQSLRSVRPEVGYFASFLTGVFFFSGWVPCVGPVLMAILALAGSSQTVGRGVLLLSVYSLGLGLPFVLIALFAGSLLPFLRRLSRVSRWVEIVSGILVIAIGVVIFTDSLMVLAHIGSLFGL